MRIFPEKGSYAGIFEVFIFSLLMSLPASYEPNHFAKVFFVTSFFHSLSWGIVLWVIASTKLRKLSAIALCSAFIFFIIETLCYLRFGSRLNPAVMTLVAQTNAKEVSEFLQVFVFQPIMLLPLAATVAAVFCYKIVKRRLVNKLVDFSNAIKIAVVITFIGGTVLPFLPFSFPIGNNTIMEFAKSVNFVRKNHNDIDKIREAISKIEITSQPEIESAPTIVFVIGESFNKNHCELYGYEKNTCPNLSKENSLGNLTVFDRAYSPTNSTAYAMKYIFTHTDCNPKTFNDSIYFLMPAVFRKAGYKVNYFDNQYTQKLHGEWDYGCTYFLNPKDINDACFDFRNSEICHYDGDFISKYKSQFDLSPGSLNIIHLMGMHADAKNRYPEGFGVFSEKDVDRDDLNKRERRRVAEYDNSVLYNDLVISNIISTLRDKNAIMLYISDHGENIYDGEKPSYGRSFGNFANTDTQRDIYSIPFFIWSSNSFKRLNSEKYVRIQTAYNRLFCLADIPFLLYDLADIDFNYNDNRRSIIDSNYVPHEIYLERVFPIR